MSTDHRKSPCRNKLHLDQWEAPPPLPLPLIQDFILPFVAKDIRQNHICHSKTPHSPTFKTPWGLDGKYEDRYSRMWVTVIQSLDEYLCETWKYTFWEQINHITKGELQPVNAHGLIRTVYMLAFKHFPTLMVTFSRKVNHWNQHKIDTDSIST